MDPEKKYKEYLEKIKTPKSNQKYKKEQFYSDFLSKFPKTPYFANEIKPKREMVKKPTENLKTLFDKPMCVNKVSEIKKNDILEFKIENTKSSKFEAFKEKYQNHLQTLKRMASKLDSILDDKSKISSARTLTTDIGKISTQTKYNYSSPFYSPKKDSKEENLYFTHKNFYNHKKSPTNFKNFSDKDIMKISSTNNPTIKKDLDSLSKTLDQKIKSKLNDEEEVDNLENSISHIKNNLNIDLRLMINLLKNQIPFRKIEEEKYVKNNLKNLLEFLQENEKANKRYEEYKEKLEKLQKNMKILKDEKKIYNDREIKNYEENNVMENFENQNNLEKEKINDNNEKYKGENKNENECVSENENEIENENENENEKIEEKNQISCANNDSKKAEFRKSKFSLNTEEKRLAEIAENNEKSQIKNLISINYEDISSQSSENDEISSVHKEKGKKINKTPFNAKIYYRQSCLLNENLAIKSNSIYHLRPTYKTLTHLCNLALYVYTNMKDK